MDIKSILIGSFFAMFITTNAQAETTRWSMISGACIPNDTTASQGLIHRDAGGAFFTHDKTGEAVLFCPIENGTSILKKVTWIKLTLNRTKAGGTIRAALFRMKESTGRTSQVGAGVWAAANHKGLGTFKGAVGESGKGHTFEEGYFYYVRITIIKHNLNNLISVKGVSLGVD